MNPPLAAPEALSSDPSRVAATLAATSSSASSTASSAEASSAEASSFSTTAARPAASFVDRRRQQQGETRGERRQFGSSHLDLSEDARELALAIDQYKVENHRRYLTCDEMLAVIQSLGYRK